jgi:integrase
MKTITDIKKFNTPERESKIICLTVKEFLTLYNHTFKSKQLDQVRDVFAFGCSTGLQLSDVVSLKKSEIHGDFIVKRIQKRKEKSTIPLNKYSAEILKKYEGTIYDEPLPHVPIQKFDGYIKECCREAGISHPKCELITSHAARMTFVALSLLMGVPERVIRDINDHKNN